MTQALILTPRDRRSAAFFWLGVGVFPVFWSWFTMRKRFPKWQRNIALSWMLVVLAVFAITLPQMSERYYLISLGLPIISFQIALWLWVWFVFRAVRPSCFDLIIWYVIFGGAFGALVPSIHQYLRGLPSQEFTLGHAVAPLIPALLHLLLSFTQRFDAGLEVRREKHK